MVLELFGFFTIRASKTIFENKAIAKDHNWGPFKLYYFHLVTDFDQGKLSS